jgi:hypothetical protein
MPRPQTTPVRIRFSGNQQTDTFHFAVGELERFVYSWKSYLNGMGARGGEFMSRSGDQNVLISLNFTQISYTEPG